MNGDDSTDDTEDATYIRLDGAQRRIRDEFLNAESGLFVLISNPGAGKSTTGNFIAGAVVHRGRLNGVSAPEENIAAVSFTRDDAASIAPGIANALKTLASDPKSEVDISVGDATELGRRVHQARTIGTVDSILQALFNSVATALGFTETSTTGETEALRDVRATCLERLRRDDELSARLERLYTAYPRGNRYTVDAGGLLRDAQLACRERQLSVEEFRTQLETIIDETYPDGPPERFEDVCDAVERFITDAAADEYRQRVSTDEASAIVTADRQLYDAWETAVDDLCVLLDAYTEIYDEVTRARGVVSHLDIAHWVARFFTDDQYASEFRDRIRARYTDRLDVVIVDEAQDISTAQSLGLAPLVDSETLVLLVGDPKQLIFLWRNAQPELFKRALENGEYFGVSWDESMVESEHRTRRCRPGIAAAINTIFSAVFTDAARGADDTITDGYTPLEATRAQTPHPSVHIAPVTTSADPGFPDYVTSTEGEAASLARCLASGLANGRFVDDEASEETPTVTALFRRRKHVEAYRDAFERAGLTVGDATKSLFGHPLVRLVVEVCSVLSHPDVDDALTSHIHDSRTNDDERQQSVLATSAVPDVLEVFPGTIHDIAREQSADRTPIAFVHGLATLARQRTQLTAPQTSLSTAVETIIDELELWSDPLAVGDDPTQCVESLDALLAHVQHLESRSEGTFEDLVSRLTRLTVDPKSGPNLPIADESAYDVVCKLTFQMKGDEDEVIALADIGAHIGQMGPHTETFCAQGSTVALAPPGTAEAAATPPIPGLEHGLFAVDRTPWDYDAGLRWSTQQWATSDRLAGGDSLASLAHAHRAGEWRLLYVACSRARNHLVIPLPTRRSEPEPRNYWVDTLRDALEFDDTRAGTYQCESPDGTDFEVRVDDSVGQEESATTSTAPVPATSVTTTEQQPPWTPRFANPSTIYPLLSEPETHILDYLQRRSLHTDHQGVDDSLPLTFETINPEDVGDIGHEVIATAIRNRERVATDTVRQCGGILAATVDSELSRVASLADDERDRLEAFLTETVCPQFAASDLWQRVQAAEEVYVEEPVDMVVRVDNLDTEIQALADVVTKSADGQWHTDEIKIVLQQSDAETRERYTLQSQFYAWGLSKQLADDATVESHITQFGVEPDAFVVAWDASSLRDRLGELRALFA